MAAFSRRRPVCPGPPRCCHRRPPAYGHHRRLVTQRPARGSGSCATIDPQNVDTASACRTAVVGRVHAVRGAQFRDAFNLPLIVVARHRLCTPGAAPFHLPGPRMRRPCCPAPWSVSTGHAYLDPAHLKDLASRQDDLLHHARMLESATIEVVAVALPAVALGAVLAQRDASGGGGERRRRTQHHQHGITAVKLLLAVLVVFGHAYEMCQSACSPIGSVRPFETCTRGGAVLCCMRRLIFLSASGDAVLTERPATAAWQTDCQVVVFRRWRARAWLRVESGSPVPPRAQSIGRAICEFNAAPGATGKWRFTTTLISKNATQQPLHPRFGPFPTLLSWWCIAFLDGVGSLHSQTLLVACISLAATGACVHLLSFFAGALVACLVREGYLDLGEVCTARRAASLVPWPLVCIQPHAAGRSRVLLAAFCFGLRVLVQRCNKGRIGKQVDKLLKIIDGRLATKPVLLCLGVSAVLIDRWGVNTPLLTSATRHWPPLCLHTASHSCCLQRSRGHHHHHSR